MDSSVFINNMLEVFDDQVDELSLDTRFRELGAWDSLTAVSTVAMMYAEYDVQVSGTDLVTCETLGELMSLIPQK